MPAGLQPASAGGSQQGPSNEERQAEQDARNDMIAQILMPEARERRVSGDRVRCLLCSVWSLLLVARIRLVRPQRAADVANMLLRMAQSGQLRGKVSEDQLIGVLDQVEAAESGRQAGKEGQKGRITVRLLSSTLLLPADHQLDSQFNRRKVGSDDDEDDFPAVSSNTRVCSSSTSPGPKPDRDSTEPREASRR